MIDDKIKTIIENNPVALATVMKNGGPNVVGVASVKVISPQMLLITDNYMNQTIEDILNNSHIAMVVWDKDWHGYKLVGSAVYYTSGEYLEIVKKMPENKNMPAKGAILVNLEKVIKSR